MKKQHYNMVIFKQPYFIRSKKKTYFIKIYLCILLFHSFLIDVLDYLHIYKKKLSLFIVFF